MLALDLEHQLTPDVYKVDVDTGSRTRVHNGRENIIEWITDRQHRVRVGIKFKDTEYEIIYCNPDGKEWKTAWKFPVFSANAYQIKIPILLVHGSMDRIVPVSQSEDMAAALKKAGKSYQYIELEEGDHWLSSYDHRLHLFQEMEKFLAANLGTGAVNVTSNQETH